MKLMNDYTITEEDIAGVLRFLQINDPENATELNARDFLLNFKAGIQELGHDNPEALLEIYETLKKKH